MERMTIPDTSCKVHEIIVSNGNGDPHLTEGQEVWWVWGHGSMHSVRLKATVEEIESDGKVRLRLDE